MKNNWGMRFILLVLIISGISLCLFEIHSPAISAFTDQDISVDSSPEGVKLEDQLISSINTGDKKLVVLSIDDGPDPIYTPQVLDILKKYKIKATFFVVGKSLETYPDLVKREITEGHEVENHTYSHPDLRDKDEFSTEQEILRTEYILKGFRGSKPNYFRPPSKFYRPETIEVAERNGYKTVLWSICAENKNAVMPKQMADRVIRAAKPGMIILTHDGRLDRSRSVQALPMIIEGLQEQGYKFVTLDQLFQAEVKNEDEKI